MRQLARTLLILGGVTACERAQPLEDVRARPAVGNIGQTGRPAPVQPAAIAQPLVDASGSPAVGNIGQTGAPPRRERVRRVQRVVRAQRPAAAAIVVETPLVNAKERPMVGNVMKGAGPQPHAFREGAESAPAQAAASPLTDRRRRPAVGNMGRSGGLRATHENLETLETAIAHAREEARLFPNNREAHEHLVELLASYEDLKQQLDAR